jgi:hypothetical protein
MVIDSINHEGTRICSLKLDLLQIYCAKSPLTWISQLYAKCPLTLDAVLGIDLENSKYTSKKQSTNQSIAVRI